MNGAEPELQSSLSTRGLETLPQRGDEGQAAGLRHRSPALVPPHVEEGDVQRRVMVRAVAGRQVRPGSPAAGLRQVRPEVYGEDNQVSQEADGLGLLQLGWTGQVGLPGHWGHDEPAQLPGHSETEAHAGHGARQDHSLPPRRRAAVIGRRPSRIGWSSRTWPSWIGRVTRQISIP